MILYWNDFWRGATIPVMYLAIEKKWPFLIQSQFIWMKVKGCLKNSIYNAGASVVIDDQRLFYTMGRMHINEEKKPQLDSGQQFSPFPFSVCHNLLPPPPYFTVQHTTHPHHREINANRNMAVISSCSHGSQVRLCYNPSYHNNMVRQ